MKKKKKMRKRKKYTKRARGSLAGLDESIPIDEAYHSLVDTTEKIAQETGASRLGCRRDPTLGHTTPRKLED